jgi:invasion protein IalB
MRRVFLHPISLSVLVLAVLAPGTSKAATVIGTFGGWTAFKARENGKKVCYIGAEPSKSAGKYKVRGEVYILVTHRPAEKKIGVVSVTAGYTYKQGSEVKIAVGDAAFKLFTDRDMAWTYDAKADRALVRAMKAGRKMTIKGTSGKGTKTMDTYSLKGFSAAYRAIGIACGVK